MREYDHVVIGRGNLHDHRNDSQCSLHINKDYGIVFLSRRKVSDPLPLRKLDKSYDDFRDLWVGCRFSSIQFPLEVKKIIHVFPEWYRFINEKLTRTKFTHVFSVIKNKIFIFVRYFFVLKSMKFSFLISLTLHSRLRFN